MFNLLDQSARKRPSSSNVETTQPKRKKDKSTSTDDLMSSNNYELLNYLEVRPKGNILLFLQLFKMLKFSFYNFLAQPDKKNNNKTVINDSTKKGNNFKHFILAELTIKKKAI